MAFDEKSFDEMTFGFDEAVGRPFLSTQLDFHNF
jgi:hypothetical protein